METAAGTVSDRNFTYNHAGGITAIKDTRRLGKPTSSVFRPDHLQRLAIAWTPRACVDCETDPSTANLGGPAPDWLQWKIHTTEPDISDPRTTASGEATTRHYALPTAAQTPPGHQRSPR